MSRGGPCFAEPQHSWVRMRAKWEVGCGLGLTRPQQRLKCTKTGDRAGLVGIIGGCPNYRVAPTGMLEDEACGGLVRVSHSNNTLVHMRYWAGVGGYIHHYVHWLLQVTD